MPTLLELLAGGKTMLEVIRAARDLHAAGAPKPSDDATFDTVFNLWGAILFEARDGCERARLMTEKAKTKSVLWAPFNFQVIDAVLPEFFRAAPAPRMLAATTRLIGRLKRIDHFQRAARPAEKWEDLDHCYVAALGFAEDFMRKGGIGEFNQILDVATTNARAHYGAPPTSPMTYLFPEPIDPLVRVAEDAL